MTRSSARDFWSFCVLASLASTSVDSSASPSPNLQNLGTTADPILARHFTSPALRALTLADSPRPHLGSLARGIGIDMALAASHALVQTRLVAPRSSRRNVVDRRRPSAASEDAHGAPSSSAAPRDRPRDAVSPARLNGDGRRAFLGRVTASSATLLSSAIAPRVGPAFAADASASAPAPLAPFVGKAGFFMRIPSGWVKAMDRSGDGPSGAGGETLALVGNFRDIDTVSVRREPMSAHPDFAEATRRTNDDDDTDGGALPRRIAEILTSAERGAVEANQALGVVAGVEGGSSGVMDFRLGGASAFEAEGSGAGVDRYFAYDFYTEVCRAKIEEISGGEKQCVGPRGDVLDTIQRRNFTVAVESDGYLYLVKASALESRWDQVGAQLREIAGSFRVPQTQ